MGVARAETGSKTMDYLHNRPVEAQEQEVPAAKKLPFKLMFWRVLVEIARAKEKTDGGIILTEDTRAAEEVHTVVGQVVDIGELAFTARTSLGYNYSELAIKPKVGDYVMIPKYGSRDLRLKDGRTFKLLEDYEILAVASHPEELAGYVY